MKKRIANHKSDMTRGVGKDCGFCEHWARHHKNQLQDLSMLQVYFLDSVDDPGRKQEDYPHLKRLEERWMVTLDSLGGTMPRLEPETGETDTGGGGKKHFPGFF